MGALRRGQAQSPRFEGRPPTESSNFRWGAKQRGEHIARHVVASTAGVARQRLVQAYAISHVSTTAVQDINWFALLRARPTIQVVCVPLPILQAVVRTCTSSRWFALAHAQRFKAKREPLTARGARIMREQDRFASSLVPSFEHPWASSCRGALSRPSALRRVWRHRARARSRMDESLGGHAAGVQVISEFPLVWPVPLLRSLRLAGELGGLP